MESLKGREKSRKLNIKSLHSYQPLELVALLLEAGAISTAGDIFIAVILSSCSSLEKGPGILKYGLMMLAKNRRVLY